MLQKLKSKVKRNPDNSGIVVSGGRRDLQLSRKQLILVVVGVAVLGTVLKILTSAESLAVPTSPNSIVVQYAFPHKMMAYNRKQLPNTNTAPFTLYGNGLMICGQSQSMPFVGKMNITGNEVDGIPTSTTLTAAEIKTLIQQISDTGFFSLKKEYFNLPLTSNQEMIRVALNSGDRFTLYYRDVAEPAAYTKTKNILRDYCKKATQPYIPSSGVTLRTINNASAKVSPITLDSIAPSPRTTIQSAIKAAGGTVMTTPASPAAPTPAKPSAGINFGSTFGGSGSGQQSTTSSNPSIAATPSASFAKPSQIVTQNISQTKAKELLSYYGSKAELFVQQAQNQPVAVVGLQPKLPQPNNELNIDFKAIRGQKVGVAGKIKSFFLPEARAANTKPVRIVIMQAADDNAVKDSTLLTQWGSQIAQWYSLMAKADYVNGGVSVIKGSQTKAYYQGCHPDDYKAVWSDVSFIDCSTLDPLASMAYNIYVKDAGTIRRTDMDTIVIPGWNTGWNMSTFKGACGAALQSTDQDRYNIGVADLNAPSAGPNSDGCLHRGNIAHEMGHTFGLQHTNNLGTLMDGLPGLAAYCDIANTNVPGCRLDPNSVDKIQKATDFFTLRPVSEPPPPEPEPSPDPIPTQSGSPQTPPPPTNAGGGGGTPSGPKQEGPGGDPLTGLYQYWNADAGDHFFTITKDDDWYGQYGYTYERKVACVWVRQYDGMQPLYRYWNSSIGDHFYSLSSAVPNGYVSEGWEGYAYPASEATTRLGVVQFHRFWNPDNTDHTYVTPPPGSNSQTAVDYGPTNYGYKYEGPEAAVTMPDKCP